MESKTKKYRKYFQRYKVSNLALLHTPSHYLVRLSADAVRVEKTRRFFQLPANVKKRMAHDPSLTLQRGWSTMGEEKTWGLFGETSGVGSPRSTDAKVRKCK